MKSLFRYFFDFILRHRIHFIGWLCFIAYEVITVGLIQRFVSFGHYAAYYVFNILLFYVHAHIILPAAKMKTKMAFWRFPLFTVLELAVYIPTLTFTVLMLNKYNIVAIDHVEWKMNYLTSIGYRGIYFIMFSTGYFFVMNYLNERRLAAIFEKQSLMTIIEKQKIEKDLVSSQHAHLKAQINPHFLFNTLNFIYTSTRKKAPEAAEAIITLSDIMRYAIDEMSTDNMSGLEEEIEHVEQLIRLHQIKSGNELNVQLSFENNRPHYRIIPFVLITLVENIFKHGDLTIQTDPARIDIVTTARQISIRTQNRINLTREHTSHHIGLDNIKKRLGTAYGEKARISAEMVNQHYVVDLIIESNLD